MAVGDLVTFLHNDSSAGASNASFQPASGVQICITQFVASAGSTDCRMRGRGSINTGNYNFYITAGITGQYWGASWASSSHKFFIDNSNYLNFYTQNTYDYNGFSGIQTQ
jgi:hypothetical protein